jgi:hypothetical protein
MWAIQVAAKLLLTGLFLGARPISASNADPSFYPLQLIKGYALLWEVSAELMEDISPDETRSYKAVPNDRSRTFSQPWNFFLSLIALRILFCRSEKLLDLVSCS